MRKHRFFVVLLLLVLAASITPAHAVFTLTLSQVGTDVIATGAGELNTAALTMYRYPASGPAILNPTLGAFNNGPAVFTSCTLYYGITGPANFGAGGPTTATSGSGNITGLNRDGGYLAVPVGYVSNSLLSNTSIYANTTLIGLGFTPGTYTYTWGTGTANADSLIVTNAVPEPSTWATFAIGIGLLGAGVCRDRFAICR